MLIRRKKKEDTTLELRGPQLAQFGAQLVVLRSTMEDTTPREFGTELSTILKELKRLKTPSREYENCVNLALQLQNQQKEIYDLRKERDYQITITNKNLQIADKEATKELAKQGIEMEQTKRRYVDVVRVYTPALLTSSIGASALSSIKNDLVLALTGYKSYFTTGCTISKVVPGKYFGTMTESEQLNNFFCNYLGPTLNYGIGGLADAASATVDKTGSFAIYIAFLIFFVLSCLLFKMLTLKRVGLTGVDFGEKKKSRRKKNRSRSRRKSRKLKK